jgi:hypothetical protein
MNRIIAICGCKRSGKDTAATFISLNYGYKPVKFAAKLKSICMDLFDLTDKQVEDDSKDEIDPRYSRTPRELMQFFGTEIMQYKIQEILPNTGRLFWVKYLLDNTKDEKIVISDMRFKHEAEEVIKMDPNAIIIRIIRAKKDEKEDTHCSEIEVKDIPASYTIYNDSSIDDLHERIREVLC